MEFMLFSGANIAKKAQMEKGKWIFFVGFSLFLLDLCQKMRFLVFFSHFFRGACSQNALSLHKIYCARQSESKLSLRSLVISLHHYKSQ